MFRYAVLSPETGLTIQRVPAAGDGEILRVLQQAAGGYLKRVGTNRPGLDAFADEEGLMKNQPYNEPASRVVYTLSGLAHRLVGPVVFASRAGSATASLTDEHLTVVATAYNQFVPEARRVQVPDLAEQDTPEHTEEPGPAEFYSLPAVKLEEGMRTADGQVIVDVSIAADGTVFAEVYTPRSDDPDQDAANRRDTDTRYYLPGERVALAVFADTDVDGRDRDGAEVEE